MLKEISKERLKAQIKRNIAIADSELAAICAPFKARVVEKGDYPVSYTHLLLLAYVGTGIIENQFQVHQATLTWQSLAVGSPLFYLLVFLLMGVLISILIPPLLLSSFRPVFILNRGFKLPGLGVHLQKMLTTVQFGIIIGLLAATTVIYQQTLFMQDLDPGITLDNKLVLRGPLGTTHYENLLPHYKQFKNEVESFPEVSAMTLSREVPGNTMEVVQGLRLEGKKLSHNFGRLTVGPGFFEDYELGVVAVSYTHLSIYKLRCQVRLAFLKKTLTVYLNT